MKHTPQEITVKLSEAERLAAAGKTQIEIANALGISVMTFHRWRNSRLSLRAGAGGSTIGSQQLDSNVDPEGSLSHIVELRQENARLRKLVTDLLLEKVKLEEEVETFVTPRFKRSQVAAKVRR